MKLKNYPLLLFSILFVVCSCKKSEDPKETKISDSQVALATASTTGHLPFTVITIAGGNVPYSGGGYTDGAGSIAKFNEPTGLELTDNGTLYVADRANNKIRKITTANVVSTVNIPNSSDGKTLFQPNTVRVSKDGTISILIAEILAGEKDKRIWMVKPNGQVLTPALHSKDYHYADIRMDPYVDYMFMCGIKPVYTNGKLTAYKGIVEKAIIDNKGVIGTDTYTLPNDSLTSVDAFFPYPTTIFCGYNKVKYLVLYKDIYKLTPSGVFTRINRDLIPYSITDLVATKDSRTLYVATDYGSIYSISNGRAQYLVGPHEELKGKDGAGKNADVRAIKLALSKDEGTLYFTDFVNFSVRKLLLR